MGNPLAYVVVFSWPLVVVILFRRLPLPKALIWSILGAYLFLPRRIGLDLPLLPPLTKVSLATLSAGLMCWIVMRNEKRIRQRLTGGTGPASRATPLAEAAPLAPEPSPPPGPARRRAPVLPNGALRPGRMAETARGTEKRTSRAVAEPEPAADPAPVAPPNGRPAKSRIRVFTNPLLAVHFLLPLLIVATNSDAVRIGPTFLPGLRPYDAASMIMLTVLNMLPFLLARRFLADSETHLTLIKALVFGGLVYSVLIMIEVRFSPQLNKWLYGFYSHSFVQHIRDGGFRPMVFLGHGLRVGIFVAMTVLAALALARGEEDRRRRHLMTAVWLGITLLLSKTLGAFAIALVLVPVMLLLTTRLQMLVAAILAGMVLFYPMLRGADVLPLDRVVSIARSIDSERAGSLQYRLDNEDQLLAKANRRPLVGWGGWGRSRVYDDESGADLSITDGTWIIEVGERGWIGYLVQFGLLTLPLILLAVQRRGAIPPAATTGLMVVLAANLVDLIPNSSLTPLTLMIAGALTGYAEKVPVPAGGRAAARSPVRGPPRTAGQNS